MHGDYSRGHQPDRKRGRDYRRVLLQMGRPVLDSDVASSVDALLGQVRALGRGMACAAGSPDLGFLVTPGRLLAVFAEAAGDLAAQGDPDAWLDFRYRYLGRYPALYLAGGAETGRVTLPLLQPLDPAGPARAALWARVEAPATVEISGVPVALAPGSPDEPQRVEVDLGGVDTLDPLEIGVQPGEAVWLYLLEQDEAAGDEPAFSIAPGSYHLDGLVADARGGGRFPAAAFPETAGFPWDASPPEVPLDGLLPAGLGAGTRLVAYLEAWERHLTAVEDPGIREEALGATDTCTRTELVGQVKLAALTGALPPGAEAAGTLRRAFGEVAVSGGRLTVEVPETTPTTDPCALPEAAGYSGADNRLYRVEVDRGGGLSQVRLKWSRDNGSELFAAQRNTDGDLVFPASAAPAAGDLVEVLSHVVDLGDDALATVSAGGFTPARRAAGQLARLEAVDAGTGDDDVIFRLVDPGDEDVPVTLDDRYGDLEQSVLKLRRWHGVLDPQRLAGDDAPSPGPHVLEEGISVALFGTGAYLPGQYWQYEARVRGENANGPWRQEPHGPERLFAPLALLEYQGASEPLRLLAWLDERASAACELEADDVAFAGARVGMVSDTVQEALEELWERPDLTGTCTVTVAPGDDLDAAVAGLPAEGGELCFQAGRYELEAPLVIRDRARVVVHGAGPATILHAAGHEAALAFEDCTEIAVRGLAVEGGSAGSTSASRHLNGAITFTGGGEVSVSDCALTCPDAPAGPRGATQTCLTARGGARPLRLTAERLRCDAGLRQTGILVVDPERARIAGNVVRVAGDRDMEAARLLDQGIVVGGGAVGTAEIVDNHVEQAIQGIHVGASGPAAGRESAGAVLLSRNVVHVRVPAGHRRERHAVFVGNARSVHVKDTIATLERTGSGTPTPVDAVRLIGVFGPFLAVSQTSLEGFTVGVHVEPLDPLPGQRMWYVSETMAAGGVRGAELPASVEGERNYPGTAIGSLTVSASGVTGGASVTGTVVLTGPAPAGGAEVGLTSNRTAAQVPASVTVPEGQTQATFTIATSAVSTDTPAVITAAFGGATASRALDVRSARAVASLSLNPSAVNGGASATGTVALTAPAEPGGAQVSLSSNNPAAQVPASVNVPAGQTQATFTITTSGVTSDASVTIGASFGSVSRTQTLTVRAQRSVSSLTLSASTVTAGGSVSGTVALNAPALAGGATVTLSSSNTAAQVPSSVTVPAGQTQASFTISTTSVGATTSATITAGFGGATRTQTLSITPAGPAMCDIPDVTGFTRTAAVGALREAGFTTSVLGRGNFVSFTDPSGTAPCGSRVVIHLEDPDL